MKKRSVFYDLRNFRTVSKIDYYEDVQIFLVNNEQTGCFYYAISNSLTSPEFYKKQRFILIRDIVSITKSNFRLFLKFKGNTHYNVQHPAIFTEYVSNGTLFDIINNRSDYELLGFNETKILINLYGIACSLLLLQKKYGITVDLSPKNIYETNEFHPKINMFNIPELSSLFKFPTYFKPITKCNSFRKILYFILTGKEYIQGNDHVNSFEISENYKKLFLLENDCIENFVDRLQNDKSFITENVDSKMYFDYVNSLEPFKEKIMKSKKITLISMLPKTSKKEKNERKKGKKINYIKRNDNDDEQNKDEYTESPFSINIQYINIDDFEKVQKIKIGIHNSIYKIKRIQNDDSTIYVAKMNQKYIVDVDIFRKNLIREVMILSMIKHPSIIEFVGYSPIDFAIENRSVIITKYVENGTLEDLLNLEKGVNEIPFWDDTMKLINIYGIATAMEYLHSKSIIHRNLNSSNVFLDKFLFPHISGFSFSKTTKMQNSDECVGSRLFCAPETIENYEYSEKSDVYSFAIVVYQILINKPFNGFFSNNNTKQDESYLKLKIGDEIPQVYKKLILSCCDKNPTKRPSFQTIVNNLKTNKEFITEKVNKKLYEFYIKYVNNEKIDDFSFNEYSLHPYYEDYFKILEAKDPLTKQKKTIDLSDYNKLNEIGNGGFGKVYKIINKKTNIIYAAKKLRIITRDIKHFKIRVQFSREITILSQIQFPSIIKYLGFSPTNISNKPKPVIVTEYLTNGTLNEMIKLEKDYEIPFWNDTMKLINIFGIASAMAYLHSKNIIHRDIKPQNILLNDYLFPKLCDFGISKSLPDQDESEEEEENNNDERNDQTNSGICGTPDFMAPEIFDKCKYTKKTDVYAFGMTMFAIYNSKYPFHSLNEFQINYMISIQKSRPSFEKLLPKVYKNLIESCWDQDPNKRPSFSDIVNELKNNQEFITENVNKYLFESYVKYIENENDKILTSVFHKYSVKSIIQDEDDSIYSYDYSQSIVSIDNFQKGSQIKEGQISNVYEITDKNTGIKYSATVSNYVENFDKKQLSGLHKEMKKISQLNHPTIQKFIGYSFVDFNHQNKPITINETCSKITLFDIITKLRNKEVIPQWNMTKKLIIIYGIAYGMMILNEHQICHTNLNLNNIFLDEKFHPKLAEIGFYTQNSSNLISITKSNENLNLNLCQFYLAPEILENQPKTDKSDVYSFAFIVYALLTEEIPFDNMKNNDHLISDIINKCYRPPFNKEIPKIYQQFIEKCWSQNANERPSFLEIIDQLESNKSFVTNDISSNEYSDYIKYIKSFNK